MKRYLLFDLDGTLTDPMVGITSSVRYALEKYGIHVKYLKELTPFIGPPLMESFQKFYGFSAEEARKAVEDYREYFSPKGIYENEVYPGVADMLAELAEAGFTLVLATSKPHVYARRILKHFGLEEFFSFVAGSELDGERVKKEEVIQYALSRCKIAPKDAVMVGDREHDILGAKACGLALWLRFPGGAAEGRRRSSGFHGKRVKRIFMGTKRKTKRRGESRND